jgi:SAM-dependent methyltransferase
MRWLRSFLRGLAVRFDPNTRRAFEDQQGVKIASRAIDDALAREAHRRIDFLEMLGELSEAAHMAGVGPWQASAAVIRQSQQIISRGLEALNAPVGKFDIQVREAMTPLTAQGAFGDIELALSNVEWRREINLSWLEFSRWGIQQIILISRLYYIKNPLIQRGINIASFYVFGRGVEVTTDDDDANDTLRDFFERNKSILGQKALTNLEKRLSYDGQVFFAFFADKVNKGQVTIRTFDATEIQDIITDPDDTDSPRYYHRQWTQRNFSDKSGMVTTDQKAAWYPALGYNPTGADRLESIKDEDVIWDTPVLHMKGGQGVSKWHFDVPRVYAALDWAKSAKNFLEACLTVKKSLAQIAMTLTTKGGQQALEGAKAQLQTNVNAQPGNSLWDTNPTAVNASIFASGPGTTLAPFNTKGAGGDPEEVRQFKLMVCMVLDIPETFLGDMNTSNLATATSLDRPTELAFIAKQEAWRETLTEIAKFVLNVSKGAPSGRFGESLRKRNISRCRIREAKRVLKPNGRFVYLHAAKDPANPSSDIEVRVNFPSIREGDMPALIKAITEAMTLDNKGGQVVGIDEKIGVRLLLEQLGIDDPDEVLEEMYPDGEYEPDRTKEPEPAPIMKALPNPGGQPQNPDGQQVPPQQAPPMQKESLKRLLQVMVKLAERKQPPVDVKIDNHLPANGHRKQKVTRDSEGRISTIEDVSE